MSEPLTVLVTVGSDHHPFDRLVGWVDSWADTRPPGSVELTVQHGTAAGPRHGKAVPFLPHDELLDLEASADVVVMQGGPLGIVESRRQGRRPVVVPRLRRLGEVVDDHQVAFCRQAADDGVLSIAESEEELHRLLDALAADPSSHHLPPSEESAAVAASVQRFAGLVAPFRGSPAPPPRPAVQPRILFLGGFGRSGSTMLERVLATVPGVFALGEMVHLWERGLRDGERCGCGEPFLECPFWYEVGERAFGGWRTLDVERMVALRWQVDRNRFIPRLLGPLRGRYGAAVAEYRSYLERLYAAAAEVSGAQLLVDSSKNPSYAYLLRRCRLQLRVVHLVRDSRGVTYSWTKQVRRPEITASSTFMPTYSPARSGLLWNAHNLLMTAYAWTGGRSVRIRYEDFTREPDAVLHAVLEHGGLSPVPQTHVDPSRSVHLGVDHTVAGNPMRFTQGDVPLRADDAWVTALERRARRATVLATWPLLRLYGYSLRRKV